MTCDFLARANSGVQALHPYVPGKPVDELERELGIRNIVKLASNENPLGPSPKVIEAIQAALPELTRYPDGNGYILKKALADTFALPLNSLTLGNGSNDVLELLARAFAGPGDEVVYSQHAFAVYPISTQAVGAKGVQVPAKNWGHDLPAMLAAITPATKLVFVANPNNPTGTWLTRTELESFLAEVPEQVLVVLDEAYTEYVQHPDFPNGLELVQRYPNLVVTRTFSKAYGLASLRVGYAVSHPQVADILNRVRQPFNVDSLALAAAVAALADKDYLAKGVALNTAGMQQFEQGFAKLGLDYIPSVGNFVCVNVGKEAAPVYQALLREGVIVRPVANYGMPTYLRISIGLPEENQRCLDALAKVLADA
ncbi:histidinol-phosphate transaminase [Balneatrix alpica]|uniref:Histidinol-phosphate aminotransferase n=1 Tax=Balneatrix alpica TaxID=75684 RepID=A0ABV5Z8V0_9GAMM|nr:histidinol-phosphate transaminase [Balneatrix alpica]